MKHMSNIFRVVTDGTQFRVQERHFGIWGDFGWGATYETREAAITGIRSYAGQRARIAPRTWRAS